MKNDRSATAIDASVAPSSWLVARRLNVVPGAITVVDALLAQEIDAAVGRTGEAE